MNGSLGKPILVIGTVAVVVSIVAGIFVIGSPRQGRLEQLDSGRVSDLKGIMTAIDEFWGRAERLPESLAELAEDPRTAVNTLDPGTSDPYGYEIVGEEAYRLCATFDRVSPESPGRPTADFWRHDPGRQCFDLEVDKTER